MQISASALLTTQQTAPVLRSATSGFAPALDKTQGFVPLPLKQVAASPEQEPAEKPKGLQRLGSTLDIKV